MSTGQSWVSVDQNDQIHRLLGSMPRNRGTKGTHVHPSASRVLDSQAALHTYLSRSQVAQQEV